MRKRKFGCFIVTFLSLTIAAGFFATAFAEDTGQEGENGSMEITADQAQEAGQSAVRQVVLPVHAEGIFDFILDPHQLINRTNAAAYKGKKFEEDATLFFERSDGGVEEDYSSASDQMRILNKGEAAVDVVLTAKMSELGGITMTDDQKFENDTMPSVYLALTDGEHTVPIDEKEGAVIRMTISGTSDDKNSCAFWLLGSANRNGDWTEAETASPRVTVTWKIHAEGEAPSEDSDTGNMEMPDAAVQEKDEEGFDIGGNVPEDPRISDGPWDVSAPEPHVPSHIEE